MDPFTTLGMPAVYALDRSVLEQRYRDLQRALHPDRFTGAPATERRMALSKAVEVNAAYRLLRDDVKRAEALVALRCGASNAEAADPDFLMTIMELREALSEAKAAADLGAVRKLAVKVTSAEQQAQQRFSRALDAQPVDVNTLRTALSELKYYRRFLDEVAVIEDEAADNAGVAQSGSKDGV